MKRPRFLAIAAVACLVSVGLTPARAEVVPSGGICALPCVENFDDGSATNMTLSGFWHVGQYCTSAPPSPPYYLGYNNEPSQRPSLLAPNFSGRGQCDYDTPGSPNSANAVLWVDLRGASDADLRFRHLPAGEPEYLGLQEDVWDVETLSLSADLGESWTELRRYNSSLADDNLWGVGIDPPWEITWRAEHVSLASYVGGVVLIRWRFDTVDRAINNTRGWMIDDISVTPQPEGE